MSPRATNSVRFHRQGSRLLCREYQQFPVVHDVPSEQQMGGAHANRNIRFATRLCDIGFGRQRLCFAGLFDELVVSAESSDHNLSIWSLPEREERKYFVDQPVAVLKGHRGKIHSISFNHRTETLASAGDENIIKLWTPISLQ